MALKKLSIRRASLLPIAPSHFPGLTEADADLIDRLVPSRKRVNAAMNRRKD